MTSARDSVPLTVRTVVVVSHSGAPSGMRFWKKLEPCAPLGKRWSITGRSNIWRITASPTAR